MNRIVCFDAIAKPDATVLILGSMPGVRSLAAQQYYAHPQNAFWKLMGALYGVDPNQPYAERLAQLVASRVALWDVLRACERVGSLDASIHRASAAMNDFDAFFSAHPHLQLVAFNGSHAQRTFDQQARLRVRRYPHRFVTLPSSSPALTWPFATKLETWRQALGLPAPSSGAKAGPSTARPASTVTSPGASGPRARRPSRP